MSIGGIIGYVYLFGAFLAIRITYKIIDREMWDIDRDDDLAEHVMSFVLGFIASFLWPFVVPYWYATASIPSRAVRKARRRAKNERELAEAERELADATAALNRAQEPRGRYIREAGR
jgi:hypothetical protein